MGQNFKKNLGLLRLLPALLLRRHPLHPQEAAQQVHSGHQKGGHRQLLAGCRSADNTGWTSLPFPPSACRKTGNRPGIGQHPPEPQASQHHGQDRSSIPQCLRFRQGSRASTPASSRPPDRVPAGAGTRISAGESAGRDTRTRPGRWGTERAWPCSRRRGPGPAGDAPRRSGSRTGRSPLSPASRRAAS